MMVSYLAGICELCGEPDSLATPEQCRRAGLGLKAAVCVACLRRMNPAAGAGTAPLVELANPRSQGVSQLGVKRR
jgi:hypothetical protein